MAEHGITFVRQLCVLGPIRFDIWHSSWLPARKLCRHITLVVVFVRLICKLIITQHAVDFFQAICNMTSGVMLPLTTADLLAMTIVGSVLENMDMERLIAGQIVHTISLMD